MNNIKVSLFASAIRPQLWSALLKSLVETSVKWEVFFAGTEQWNDGFLEIKKFCPEFQASLDGNSEFKYIHTENIKPAQCYEIARRHCTGETVVWTADDCEFPNDVIGKAYNYWKSKNNEKLILSIQTKESGYLQSECKLFDMNEHRLFGGHNDMPLMAPIALMSRKFLDDLGGIDKRYICGQYENDIVMRAYQHGATVEIFGDSECCVEIDHLKKSIDIGESKNEEEFLNRPFAKGYGIDRQVLQKSWCIFNQKKLEERIKKNFGKIEQYEMFDISPTQLDKFEPYVDDGTLLVKSQGNNLTEVWG